MFARLGLSIKLVSENGLAVYNIIIDKFAEFMVSNSINKIILAPYQQANNCAAECPM